MSPRSPGRLISITSVHDPSPSTPIFTNLNIQATHPPLVREWTRKYPTGQRTPNLAALPLAEIGLLLAESKTLLARLQAGMLCGQVAAYAALCPVYPECRVLQPLKDRRTRRLQTLFGTVEVEAPGFQMCRCRQPVPMAEARTVSPVCTLLTARCTPELERVQAELGARTSFRDAAGILDRLLPVSPANQESVRTHTRGHPAARGGRQAGSYGGHGCPERAGQGRSRG